MARKPNKHTGKTANGLAYSYRETADGLEIALEGDRQPTPDELREIYESLPADAKAIINGPNEGQQQLEDLARAMKHIFAAYAALEGTEGWAQAKTRNPAQANDLAAAIGNARKLMQ